MRRIKLTVAYDGTDYCGWQVQNNGATIEGELNTALTQLTGQTVKVIGASRTDAGVHARGNVAVFDTESSIPPERFLYAVNALLPEDIVVVDSCEVAADWHPRHCNTEKTYEYRVLNQKLPDPMRRRDTYFVSFPLDLEKMRKAAGYLEGEHDFKSFCNVHTHVEDTVRTIYRLEVIREENVITFRVRGNGFLYNDRSRKRTDRSGRDPGDAGGKRPAGSGDDRAAAGADTGEDRLSGLKSAAGR